MASSSSIIVSRVNRLGTEPGSVKLVCMANVAINGALIAAVQQQAAVAKLIIEPLKRAGALNAHGAVTLDLSAKGADKALAGLVKLGHVHAAGEGRYWLDEAAIARSNAAGTRAALIMIAFLLSLAASLIALLAS